MKPTDLLTYSIDADVTAFTTTRHGGCSSGNYASMNANYYCGDNIANVENNREALCSLLGIHTQKLILPRQTHSTNILNIAPTHFTLDDTQRSHVLENVDALITSQTECAICVSTADCVPIIVYDKRLHVAAAIHAGWRGTVGRIAEKTLQMMHQLYGTCGTDCCAVIGPSISVDNFEVGDEVYEAFSEAGFNMHAIAVKQTKWHIDLWRCNQLQMQDCGIRTENIHTVGICTYSQHKDFFSARRLGILSGRMLTGIIIHQNTAFLIR